MSDLYPMVQESKTYVLVHGAFHGAWCWKEVAAGLRALGHSVYTPTLTGLGERSHLLSFRPTLDTFLEDVLQLLRYEEPDRVILVGHSFAGAVITGVADRMPERLRHLVYLDAVVPQSGEAALDPVPSGHAERYRRRATESSNGLSVPPHSPDYYGITDTLQASWLLTKLTPHPFQTFVDRLELNYPVGNGIPATYIACSNPFFATTAQSRALAKSLPGWSYLEIPTAHNAMLLLPRELTEMLAAIG